MKKEITLVIFIMALCTFTNAQNYVEVNVTEFNQGSLNSYCASLDSILIDQDGSCQNTATWTVVNSNGATFFNGRATHITITSEMGLQISISYSDCHINEKWFLIEFTDFEEVPEPWTENTMWFVWGSTPTLQSYYSETLNYLWSDNSTNWEYTITSPEKSGTIWVRMYNDCGELSDTINVYYGEGVYRATVDLETNLNKVIWQTTPQQTEYISEVKVYRDGMFVGTVPYEQGYFLDNIGSDNAARNYHLVSVTPNGEESPASAPKGTIHTTYYLDVNDNLNMTWNIPYGTQGTLTYFQICKYDYVTGGLTVVDQVNASITDYTCSANQFAGGYPVIAAVFNDAKNREFEDLSFSNMYTDISVQPQEITITLMPGWNWISYPYAVAMNIASALGDFVPVEGDIIKSQMNCTTIADNGEEVYNNSLQALATIISRRAPSLPLWSLTCQLFVQRGNLEIRMWRAKKRKAMQIWHPIGFCDFCKFCVRIKTASGRFCMRQNDNPSAFGSGDFFCSVFPIFCKRKTFFPIFVRQSCRNFSSIKFITLWYYYQQM